MIWGRVVGGGFRVGNSCTPVVDSCQSMAKPIQYYKVKKLKKKKERKFKTTTTRELSNLTEYKITVHKIIIIYINIYKY